MLTYGTTCRPTHLESHAAELYHWRIAHDGRHLGIAARASQCWRPRLLRPDHRPALDLSASNQFTASLATTGVLTVTAITVGQIQMGSMISGSGVPGGTYVTANVSGTGGDRHISDKCRQYALSQEPSRLRPCRHDPSSGCCRLYRQIATTGILTVSAITSGELAPAQIVYGTGVTPNPVILARSAARWAALAITRLIRCLHLLLALQP